MNNIVIGKRITFGAAIGGAVSVLAWVSETFWQTPIPAEIAVAVTTVITAIGQVFIVNKYGVTTNVSAQ